MQTKPPINRWAIIRYLRCYYDFLNDIYITPREVQELSLARRLRLVKRAATRRVSLVLMGRVNVLRRDTLIPQLIRERKRPQHLPVADGCDPLVAEALFLSRDFAEDRNERERARVHRGVRCAGGCGTRFGKRRQDHDFLGGEGIHGGWICPTTPCHGRRTGDHYCGMCREELRQSSETPQLSDTRMIALSLDPHPEYPDLQDY